MGGFCEVHVECYLARLQEFQAKFPRAKFYIITRTAKSPLSPSMNLLSQAKTSQMPFPIYAQRLKAEIKLSEAAQHLLFEIAEMSKNRDVFLVCYEKDPNVCHRSIVKELVQEKQALLSGKKVIAFSMDFAKLKGATFSTIRLSDKGLQKGDIVLIRSPSGWGRARVTLVYKKRLGDLPKAFLSHDMAPFANFPEECLRLMQSFYPEIGWDTEVAVLVFAQGWA